MATTPATACKIISHSGGGLYVVEVQYDDTARTERMAEIDQQLLDPIFIAELARLKTAWDDAVALRNAWVNFLNGKILNYQNAIISEIQADIDATAKLLREATTEGLKSRNAMILANLSYHQLKAKNKALAAERLALFRAGNPSLPLLQVWCIDLADGLNGRAIYANGSYAPLLCLNYNADGEHYLLPPKNPGAATVTPQGIYNLLNKYRPHDAAGFTFWNGAMEPGFAKWQPILLKGILVGSNDPNPTCSSSPQHGLNYRVAFPGNKSRLGYETAYGEFTLSFGGSVLANMFYDGDEVVVLVTDITESSSVQAIPRGYVNDVSKNIKTTIKTPVIYGTIIGWAHNPRPLAVDYGTLVQYVTFTNLYIAKGEGGGARQYVQRNVVTADTISQNVRYVTYNSFPVSSSNNYEALRVRWYRMGSTADAFAPICRLSSREMGGYSGTGSESGYVLTSNSVEENIIQVPGNNLTTTSTYHKINSELVVGNTVNSESHVVQITGINYNSNYGLVGYWSTITDTIVIEYLVGGGNKFSSTSTKVYETYTEGCVTLWRWTGDSAAGRTTKGTFIDTFSSSTSAASVWSPSEATALAYSTDPLRYGPAQAIADRDTPPINNSTFAGNDQGVFYPNTGMQANGATWTLLGSGSSAVFV